MRQAKVAQMLGSELAASPSLVNVGGAGDQRKRASYSTNLKQCMSDSRSSVGAEVCDGFG